MSSGPPPTPSSDPSSSSSPNQPLGQDSSRDEDRGEEAGSGPPTPNLSPDLLLTLSRSLLETLELQRTLYVILSVITSGEGLDFNRAFLFLSHEGGRMLRGQMAIGPISGEEAHRIWEEMAEQQFDLELLMERYATFFSDPNASALSQVVQQLSFPLPLGADGGSNAGGPEEFLSLLGSVMEERHPIIVNERRVRMTGTEIMLQCLAMVPLMVSDRPVGVLVVDNPFNLRFITQPEMGNLVSLVNLAAVAVERARLYERIRRMASQDGLTGLMNRRQFDEVYPRLFQECAEHREQMSVVMMDVDEFKEINDQRGHLVGDDMLRYLSTAIQDRIRKGDVAVRYGGDEMVLVLLGADSGQARRVIEEIRAAFQSGSYGSEQPIRATLSVGIASFDPSLSDCGELLARADAAMYSAKRRGKNQVVVHQEQA